MKYILTVDQSTSATKALLVDEQCRVCGRISLPHAQHYPHAGWVEHDALEILHNVRSCLETLCELVGRANIEAIALSNQRETTVLWDAKTGEPLCPAIVWRDTRARALCDTLAGASEQVRQITGLTLSPYYPAAKAMYALQAMGRTENVRIGTMDSFLIASLCGRSVTDISNAGRTELMNLRSCAWDEELLRLFGIRREMLAEEILPSDSVFGTWQGIPIRGVMGDSHAALYGHGCHTAGSAKATYGTGSSVMLNTGKEIRLVPGLQCCVGFADKDGVRYVQEGNVTCSGDTLVFLQDIGLFESAAQIEAEAAKAGNDGGMVLVPAFAGLGAPYFAENARGLLCGMSRGASRGQIAYAALSAVAQQNADVLEAMGGVESLHADGGPTANRLLMQLQADLIGCDVRCTAESEMSAMGAAKMAGMATGFFPSFPVTASSGSYQPACSAETRQEQRARWRQAVRRAMQA